MFAQMTKNRSREVMFRQVLTERRGLIKAFLLVTALILTALLPNTTSVHINNSITEQHYDQIVVEGEKPAEIVEVANQSTPVNIETPVIEPVQEAPIRGSHEDILTTTGIPMDQWYAVEYILGNESTDWCPTRVQGYYGNCLDYVPVFQEDNNTVGYGICQSTPANKMASAGDDWKTNIYTQMKWCDSYAIGRYGNWHNAYTFWSRNRWWQRAVVAIERCPPPLGGDSCSLLSNKFQTFQEGFSRLDDPP